MSCETIGLALLSLVLTGSLEHLFARPDLVSCSRLAHLDMRGCNAPLLLACRDAGMDPAGIGRAARLC
jgi:hypothetical protein